MKKNFKDLQEFIECLDSLGELRKIESPVSPEIEISKIVDAESKKPGGGKALLFENVVDNGKKTFPVAANLFGSEKRMALAIGAKTLAQSGDRIAEIARMSPPRSFSDIFAAAKKLFPLVKIFPKKISGAAPCQEVAKFGSDVDLSEIPVLKCWPKDGGRFFTLPLVFTKSADGKERNVGMYRLQKYDGQTTGMHWHLHKDGASNYRAYKELGMDKIEVAVAIGTDPVVTYSATAPLPRDIDEMVFAGFLRKKSVEMVKCKTVDVEVPATSEIVLEGYVNIGETRREGPFGDHTGYYSLADDYPVFHITCITHRKNPIYAATIVGKPPMEDCYLAKATERIFLPLLQQAIPEIRDINFPLEGVFHDCVMVSIKKTYPQQAKKVMHALWGMGQMMFTKLIIVVDEHVDVQNEKEVWWRVYNNIDAKHDLVMVDGPLDALDHSSPMAKWGTKIGIDATKTWPEEGHTREWPDEITMSDDIKKIVDNKWKELGLE